MTANRLLVFDWGGTLADSACSMEMAGRADVTAVATSYGVHDRERLLQYEPLLCIDNLPALTHWLQDM